MIALSLYLVSEIDLCYNVRAIENDACQERSV